MKLNTLATPNEITSLEDFIDRALGFDFYTDMSDDHRVYSAGKRARELMDKYAEENPIAKRLWKKLCRTNLDLFMAGQLIDRVNGVVLDHQTQTRNQTQTKLNELKTFTVGYLATTGRESMIGKATRRAIAKKIPDCPANLYHYANRRKRDEMIDNYINDYKKETSL